MSTSAQTFQVLAATLIKQAPEKIHAQEDCLLFNKLPYELRTSIWKFSLVAYDNKEWPYQEDHFSTRPGYRYPSLISTTLLQTCRRIYLEAYMLPVTANEIVAWCYRNPDGGQSSPLPRLKWMIPEQIALGTNIHLFTQQYWLEDGWRRLTSNALVNPKTLHITLRHSDWWDWERGDPLALDPKQKGRPQVSPHSEASDPFPEGSWGASFRELRGLKEFKFELETVVAKKVELDDIVARANTWRFPLGDGKVLVLDESKTTTFYWTGPPLHTDDGHEGSRHFEPIARARRIPIPRRSRPLMRFLRISRPLSGTSQPAQSSTVTPATRRQQQLLLSQDPSHSSPDNTPGELPAPAATAAEIQPQQIEQQALVDHHQDQRLESHPPQPTTTVTKWEYYIVTLRWFAH